MAAPDNVIDLRPRATDDAMVKAIDHAQWVEEEYGIEAGINPICGGWEVIYLADGEVRRAAWFGGAA